MKGIGPTSMTDLRRVLAAQQSGKQDVDSEAINMTAYNRTRLINLGVISLDNVYVGSGWRVKLTSSGHKLVAE